MYPPRIHMSAEKGPFQKNKPRCYPQQRLGNNASKENLRARLFPILRTHQCCLPTHAMQQKDVSQLQCFHVAMQWFNS